eukprot:3135145-Pleurochrysis_carterae.AAC.2
MKRTSHHAGKRSVSLARSLALPFRLARPLYFSLAFALSRSLAPPRTLRASIARVNRRPGGAAAGTTLRVG